MFPLPAFEVVVKSVEECVKKQMFLYFYEIWAHSMTFGVYDSLIGLGIRISPPADQAYDSIFDIRRQEASQNPFMEKIT